jgi:hypothetical protein
MSDTPAAKSAAARAGSGAGRVMRAWRSLPPERRLAASAAIGLFATLFLPWYQETVLVANGKKLPVATASVTGWGAFSFVEAAVLLVATGVLVLLFQRAEGKAFHVPGGDGGVITVAGGWTCVLVVWRIFDKQGTSVHGQGADISGIEWGIFVALAVAAVLTYSGTRIRSAHRAEPPLPGEEPSPNRPPSPSPPPPARRRAQAPRPVAADVGRPQPPAQAPRPTRRRRTTTSRAERGPVAEPRVGPADWKEPATDWIDGEGRRVQRNPGRGDGPQVRRDAGEDPPTRRGAGEDPPTRRDAGRESEQRRSAGDDPRADRSGPDEDRTEPLGPSTHAARRLRPTDDQLTIPLVREDELDAQPRQRPR